MTPPRRAAAISVAILAALALGGWVTVGRGGAKAASAKPVIKSPLDESLGGRRGGVLRVLDESEFEHLDPGQAYYALDYTVVYATQRPLYSVRPNSTRPSPDLAAGPPAISDAGKLVTVRIKRGIHFSPPVNREVTSADIAYAIERGANPNVANPYIHSYFGSLEGIAGASGGPIKGIRTPNRHEIVFKLTRPDGRYLAEALQLPLTAPVPKRYAGRFDRHKPSDYEGYEVATGPYMLKSNAAGRAIGIGYVPGRSLTLVRNPNWRRSSDSRPAYLNEIRIRIGGNDTKIGLDVLKGKDILENTPPSEPITALAALHLHGQLEISPGAGDHYIAVNNKVGPFSNIDLRKALWAALDRSAMDQARGGALVSAVAGHFLYPGIPGFQRAGGYDGPKGPQFDFDEHPEGDLAIAEKYMRLAGYSSGKYSGAEKVRIVGARGAPAEEDAEIVNGTLESLGFRTELRLVEDATMYVQYCNRPSEEVTVCPSVGWLGDFADPQTVLDPTFNGAFINPVANVNWGQTDVPQLNQEMTAAETLNGNSARASAWAKIDDELVEDAAAIPFDWDRQPSIEGRGVKGVADLWNDGSWDYSWTSLK